MIVIIINVLNRLIKFNNIVLKIKKIYIFIIINSKIIVINIKV